MARRKSSRGRVFYYPSSLPKMQDGDKLPTNQSEYEDVLGVIKEYRGYKPSDVNEVLNKIAWHESALSMDPTKKQELNDGSFGKGRGLYQFEPDALTTAINSTKNLYTNAGKEIPDWVKSIDTKDASILPASQQSALAAASMIQRENFIFDKALKSDEGLTEAWGKGWQTKNDPKKKELFKKHLESYYTKKEESPATFYSVYEEPGANIKPNPNLRTREEILSMLVGRDYTRTPKESSYNPQQRLIKDIMDENKALYKVGNPKDFNIIPADERMTQHLEKTGRGLEYLDAKDTWIPFKDRPTAKLRIPGEGANRVVINTEDIDPKELKEAVALDFISHSMDEDKTYRKYKDKINTELVNKYGQEFIDRNGGIDAYVRGIIADRNNPEYQPYKEETAFLNKSLVNDFKKYIKTGEKPSKGLFNFRYGGGITGNNDESNGLIPVRVDVANKSTTWNPKFTDIINNPSNYSQAEVIDAIQKMSALFPDSDKIITTPGVSPSEAGIRYVEPDPATGLPKLKNGGIPDRYKNKGFTKVGAKKQSTRPGKKWMVLAKKGDDYKVVHGGYKGMKDFSQHGSEDRKKKFWSRMGGKDSAKAKDPFSPLYWHKRFGTWEYGGDIQKQGYKDNSPYKNRRYIDIYSNNITMDGVSQPLQVTTDKGQQMVLPPNSGEYYFPNADAVRETPLVDLPSYFSGSKINLTRYQQGDSLAKAQFGTDIDDTLDKADSEVYRLYLSGKHLKQGYPDAEQSGTGRLYPDAKEVSPNFEYEGDKHWNTKRFAYAPFFNKIETDGYHYRTNDGGTAPLDLPKGDKARKKMLIGDMTTYFKASGYSDEEANQKAKNYVKKEVMPLVNSKWDKQHDKGKSSIGRVDQFDAPQLYNYVDSKGEKKLKKLFYNKKENKRLNEGYIQSPKKLKRLDKDFNIKFRGLSKQDAKTEANFNYNNYKDKRYTVAQFKADKKLHGYQDGGSLPMYQDGDKIDYIKKQIKTIPQYFNPKTYSYNNEEGLNTIPNYNKHNSFDKAFKQAREDLGRGQTFLYNGKRYTTNKENEFPNDESETVFNTMTKTLSPEQKNKAKEYYFKQGAPKLILGVDDDKFAILPSAQVSFADLSPEDSRPHINPLGPSNKVYLQDYNFDYSDLLPEDRPKYDDDVRLLIDELAHIEQQRNMGTGPFFKDFLFDAIKGEVSKKSPYDTEGAIEHSAHEVIGPKRLKGIMGYRNGGQLPKAEIMIDPATGLPKLKSGGKTWIQEAIKKPGSLRATAKRAGAIKSDGTIKKIWLKEKAKGSGKTA